MRYRVSASSQFAKSYISNIPAIVFTVARDGGAPRTADNAGSTRSPPQGGGGRNSSLPEKILLSNPPLGCDDPLDAEGTHKPFLPQKQEK